MILITGATGNVGRNLVTALHTAGHPVRALARHARPDGFPAGVDVIAGDLTNPATAHAALTGVESAFLFPVFGGITPFLDAARDHRLDHLVMLSSAAVTFREPGWIGQQHQILEHHVRASGIPATFVRPDVFMANDLAWAESIRTTRTVRLAYPDATTAPIDERDIAAVAAAALIEHYRDVAYEVTGPESLSQADRIHALAAVLDQAIELIELTPVQAATELQQAMPAEATTFFLNTLRQRVASPAPTTSTVREVTGQPAHTYQQWVRHRRDDFTANL